MSEPNRRVRVSAVPASTVERIRRAYEDGVPTRLLKERFGLSETTIRRLVREGKA